MEEYIIVYITTANDKEAQNIGRGIVEKKIAACVQITRPIQSIYTWKGKICEEEEVLMIVKTKQYMFDTLAEYVKKNHPYEIPQIVAVPIVKGTQDYLGWINKTVINPEINDKQADHI